MIEAIILLAIPLFLRWYTVSRMSRMRAVVRHREEQVAHLQSELEELVSASRDVGQVARRFSVRRSLLDQEIDYSRQELEGLRAATASEKLAA